MLQGYVAVGQLHILLDHLQGRVPKDLLKAERVASVQNVLRRECVSKRVR